MTKLRMQQPRLKVAGGIVQVPDRHSKRADAFYTGREWRQLVADIKRQRGDKCEECDVTGVRIAGDHVVEIKDGGAKLDPANVMLRCGKCHAKKTAAERDRRMAR